MGAGIPESVLSRAREIAEFEDRGEPVQAKEDSRREGGALTLASPDVSYAYNVVAVRFCCVLIRWCQGAGVCSPLLPYMYVKTTGLELRLHINSQTAVYFSAFFSARTVVQASSFRPKLPTKSATDKLNMEPTIIISLALYKQTQVQAALRLIITPPGNASWKNASDDLVNKLMGTVGTLCGLAVSR